MLSIGNIAEILGDCKLKKDRLMSDALWYDLCENIHLHYRDLRIEFSIKEFVSFIASAERAFKGIQSYCSANEYKEGGKFIAQWGHEKIEKQSAYHPNRLQIEMQENGQIHIHYRDMRIEVDEETFLVFCYAFKNAEDRLIEWKENGSSSQK